MNNFYLLPYFFFPPIPNICDKPPTVYSILESIVNFGKVDKEKIKDLAKYGRTTIFDFNYPLSSFLNKEDFETMILNHYLMRRIGFETVTAFQIQLNVKLNEIMPSYNKMFDLVYENSGLGEIEIKEGFDNRTIDLDSGTTNNLSSKSTRKTTGTDDRRYSDTPQSKLSDVRDGSYVTDYTYDTSENNSSDQTTQTGSMRNTQKTQNDNNYKETRTKIDKFKIYQEIQDKKMQIYTMIFKDLDSLFYGLV